MSQPNLNGPESVPLRDYVKSFPLIVRVYDDSVSDDKDNLLREETIDYGNYEHRKWLGRITFWSCSNGYVVETRKA